MTCSVLYPLTGTRVGGSVVSTAMIAREISANGGWEVIVALPFQGESAALFEQCGLRMICYGLSEKRVGRLRQTQGMAAKAAAAWPHIVACRLALKWLREVRPSLLHINDDSTMLNWGLAARRLGIPVIWHVRQQKGNRFLDRVRLGIADEVILVADAVRKRFRFLRKPPETAVIYNAVDTEEFHPAEDRSQMRQALGLDPHSVVLGFVGNLVARKRPQWVARAAASLLDAGIRMDTLFIGADFTGGEYEKRLRRMAADSADAERFHFLGYRADIPELMRALDIVALPSVEQGEAFPRVLLEAMASGATVVASRVAGVPELVENGRNGLLFDADDVQGFQSAVRLAATDSELRSRLAWQARQDVEARFGMGTMTQAMLRVYSSAVEGSVAGDEQGCNVRRG